MANQADTPGALTVVREAVKEQKKRFGVIVTWIGGIVAALLVGGLGWAVTGIAAAERVNEVQDARIKSIEERANEDRTKIQNQLDRQSDKLDRILERVK